MIDITFNVWYSLVNQLLKGGENVLNIKLKDSATTRLKIAETGKSLRGFSDKIGISQGYLSQILKGECNPSPKVAYKIVKGLNLNIEDIFLINSIDISINKTSSYNEREVN